MKNIIFTILTLLCYNSAFAALVSWSSTTSGNWNDGANWSTGLPPAPDDYAFIGKNVVVTIPDGVIAYAGKVGVRNGATLIIEANGTLEIDGINYGSDGLEVGSTFSNYGLVKINNVFNHGILCYDGASFNNEIGGVIDILNNQRTQIENKNAQTVFTNRGILRLQGASLGKGIENTDQAHFINASTGTVEISNTSSTGIWNKNVNTLFKNEGQMTIHSDINGDGIVNDLGATFETTTGSNLIITDVRQNGIYNGDAATSFVNHGNLYIAKIELAKGIYNRDAVFINGQSGVIDFDSLDVQVIHNTGISLHNTFFWNYGIINFHETISTIGINNTNGGAFINETNSQLHFFGENAIYNRYENTSFLNKGSIVFKPTVSIGAAINNLDMGHFTNAGSGTIAIQNVSTGIMNRGLGTSFNNIGIIDLQKDISNIGLSNIEQANFQNAANAEIRIHDAYQWGIYNSGISTNFTNEGEIFVDSIQVFNGLWNSQAAKFTNAITGKIMINSITADGLENSGDGALFQNNGFILLSKGLLENGIANRTDGVFMNSETGNIVIGGTTQTALLNYDGEFVNDGTIRTLDNILLSGIHNFNGGDFTNTATGRIIIRNTNERGLINHVPEGDFPNTYFFNAGYINIDSVGMSGIINAYGATFYNQPSGNIVINHTGFDGVLNQGTVNSNYTSHFYNENLVTFKPGVTTQIINGNGAALFTNLSSGTIVGNGDINGGFFSNEGVLSPGFSPGTISISSDYNHSNGTYIAEIAGIQGPGLQNGNDLLFVSGDIILGGTLNVNLIDNFQPEPGNSFILVQWAGSATGNFNNIQLPPLENAEWEVKTENDLVRLNVVAPLPVEFLNFDARQNDNTVILHWATATEVNNKGFEVERSRDGRQWEKLGFINGFGTSSDTHNYKYIDKTPLSGTNYYRLRQVDFDGNFDYSEVKSVRLNSNKPSVQLYPNPANHFVKISGLPVETSSIQITNQFGQVMFSKIISYEVTLNIEDWTSGVYVVYFNNNHEKQAFQFVKK